MIRRVWVHAAVPRLVKERDDFGIAAVGESLALPRFEPLFWAGATQGGEGRRTTTNTTFEHALLGFKGFSATAQAGQWSASTWQAPQAPQARQGLAM